MGDGHDDFRLDKKRFELAGKYVVDTKPQHFGLIGDFLTFDSCNSHDKNHTLRGKRKSSIPQDLESGAKAMEAMMTPIVMYNEKQRQQKGKMYKPKKFITTGNHEDRFARYINENPEMHGLYETMLLPIFTRWGFEVVPYGKYHRVHDMYYIHIPMNKIGKPFSSVNLGRQIAQNVSFNITHGHRHECGYFVEPKISADDSTSRGIHIICTGAYLPVGHVEDYAELSQACWTSNLVEQTFIDGKYVSTKFISLAELEAMYS